MIDRVDSSAVFFHQTEDTGFTNFCGDISETNGNGAGSLGNPSFDSALEFNPMTGDLLYIANRDAITRDAGQKGRHQDCNSDLREILCRIHLQKTVFHQRIKMTF